MAFPAKVDPLRETLSRFASGLEQFYDSLHQFRLHASDSLYAKARTILLILAIRCLVLQTILNLITNRFDKNLCASFNQLFYPTILLFRFLHPRPWDELFMTAVHALDCGTRVDIVGRPGPDYFAQLRQFLYRNFKAYVLIGSVHYLVNRRGIFAWPSIILGLLAIQQYLRYKGVQHSLFKLVFVTIFIGPRWAVWLVQVSIQQQLFLYELLQPYLARVQFKVWEEKAWWAEHELELQGFAFGVWVVCSIPVIGVAAIPVMFPAVAFLLTRSCGLMENSGNGVSGDIIEKRTPGIKAVALNKSKAVAGNWNSTRVETFVQNLTLKVNKPVQHLEGTAVYHDVDDGVEGAVSRDQVLAEKELSITKKRELYLVRQRQEKQQEQNRAIYEYMAEQRANAPLPRVAPIGSTTFNGTTTQALGVALPSAPALTPSAPVAMKETAAHEPPASSESVEAARLNDLTSYNFSDRKTLETAPSAPPESSFIPPLISDDIQGWTNYLAENDVYRIESATDDSLPVSSANPTVDSVDSAFLDAKQETQKRTKTQEIGIQEEANLQPEEARQQQEAGRQRGEASRQRGESNQLQRETDRSVDLLGGVRNLGGYAYRLALGEGSRRVEAAMRKAEEDMRKAEQDMRKAAAASKNKAGKDIMKVINGVKFALPMSRSAKGTGRGIEVRDEAAESEELAEEKEEEEEGKEEKEEEEEEDDEDAASVDSHDRSDDDNDDDADDDNGNDGRFNSGIRQRRTGRSYEATEGTSYYDRSSGAVEQIPMQSRGNQPQRQRRQNPRSASESTAVSLDQRMKTEKAGQICRDEGRIIRRSRSETSDSTSKAQPHTAATQNDPPIQMHYIPPSRTSTPQVPAKDNIQLLPKNKPHQSKGKERETITSVTGSLSAIVAENLENIEVDLDRKIDNDRRHIWTPTAHVVPKPLTPYCGFVNKDGEPRKPGDEGYYFFIGFKD